MCLTVLYDKSPHPHDLSNPVLFQAVTELFSKNLSLRACLHVLPRNLIIAHKHSRKGRGGGHVPLQSQRLGD